GCEWGCSFAPGGRVASSTRTRGFSNLTLIVFALTTAGSCAAATRRPATSSTAAAIPKRSFLSRISSPPFEPKLDLIRFRQATAAHPSQDPVSFALARHPQRDAAAGRPGHARRRDEPAPQEDPQVLILPFGAAPPGVEPAAALGRQREPDRGLADDAGPAARE